MPLSHFSILTQSYFTCRGYLPIVTSIQVSRPEIELTQITYEGWIIVWLLPNAYPHRDIFHLCPWARSTPPTSTTQNTSKRTRQHHSKDRKRPIQVVAGQSRVHNVLSNPDFDSWRKRDVSSRTRNLQPGPNSSTHTITLRPGRLYITTTPDTPTTSGSPGG